MTLVDRFASFFKDENAEADSVLYERSCEVVDWMNRPFHARFEQWLEDEASRPIPIGPNTVEFAMRVNTLREVQKYLKRTKAEAENAIRQIQEEV